MKLNTTIIILLLACLLLNGCDNSINNSINQEKKERERIEAYDSFKSGVGFFTATVKQVFGIIPTIVKVTYEISENDGVRTGRIKLVGQGKFTGRVATGVYIRRDKNWHYQYTEFNGIFDKDDRQLFESMFSVMQPDAFHNAAEVERASPGFFDKFLRD